MKSSSFLLILPLAVIILQCCRPTDKTEEMGDTTTGIDHTVVGVSKAPDRETLENEIQTAMFIEKAALGGMLEIALGKLAREKALNLRVKDFGKLMELDHARINADLKVLSSSKGLRFPVSLSAKDLEQIREMSKMETEYFEKLYIKIMIEDHNKDIELFSGAGESPDVLVSDFANKYLPVLERYRLKALEVREAIQ
jgi:putative membrane protein